MFYTFNNFTGRLIGASHTIPYYPVSPRPLDKNEPPKIIFETPDVKIAKVPEPNSTNSFAKTLFHGGIPQKLIEKQKHFQKADGIPVYLKGGPADKVLYGLTLAVGAVGFAFAFKFIYEAAYPKRE